jgi:two-component system chemotaxis response regulator CheY
MSTVLVVDDSVDLRLLVAAILRKRGFNVHCAENGREALEALNGGGTDAVVLDLNMPVMDGLTFLKVAREDPRYRDLPVVVFSAYGEGEMVPQLVRLGVKDVLLKAFTSPSEIAVTLKKRLEGGAKAA